MTSRAVPYAFPEYEGLVNMRQAAESKRDDHGFIRLASLLSVPSQEGKRKGFATCWRCIAYWNAQTIVLKLQRNLTQVCLISHDINHDRDAGSNTSNT